MSKTKTTTQSTSDLSTKHEIPEIYLRTSHVILIYHRWQHWYQWSQTCGAVSS